MERNREARRGTVAAVNGGLSRRRQRSSSLRDSPEDDGGTEMAETTRLRDRGSKKERDRDRSSRSKRRRGERMLHGSNRDEGDDSSEESVDEEDEEEEDDVSVAVRLPLPPPPPSNPASSSSSLPQSNHHHNHQQQNRKSFPAKVTTRTPPVWKADEMIGFSVPRKARSASTKRSHECWVSGGPGSGEQIPRQASTSPSRLSPASTTQISPSSSNASARKKMKPMGGPKHRPPKVSKSPSLIQEDIEIEVAEVLYGMTRQFQCPLKQETSKIDPNDTNGGSVNEAKSRVSSPNSSSPAPPASQPSVLPPSNSSSNPTSLPTAAPKRKKPRPVKFEEESPSSSGGLLAQVTSKMEPEHQMKADTSSPRSEKNAASPITENGCGSIDVSVPPVAAASLDVQQESAKMENNPVPDSKLLKGEPDGQNRMENQKESTPPVKETPSADLEVNRGEEITAKAALTTDSRREERFCIDLMAPPPGKLSPERDSLCEVDADHRSQAPEIEMALKVDTEKKEEKSVEKTAKVDEMGLEVKKVDKSTQEEFDLKKQMAKERTLDLQIDLEKPDKDSLSSNKLQLQKHQQKSPKIEPKHEKAAPSVSPPAMPMTFAGWPGSLPPFGYMGQVPSLQAVVPMDGSSGASNSLQPPSFLSPPPRPRRCATHCYIAQNIYYHQRISRMNPFWHAAAGATPLYGAKPYNPNVLPPSDGRNIASFQDNKGAPMVAAYLGPPSKERIPAANNAATEVAQKKQLVLQQLPQSGSATNMLHGPTFIFPLNQQQAAAAAAAAATTRSGASKSTPGSGNGAPSSGASNSAVASTGTGGGSAATMNLSFAGLPPNEAPYLAILQNNAYPFPIPAHVAGPPPFRGASTAQAMPFFNGPFYASQMLHPSQIQQPQLLGPPPPPHTKQGHQHTSTSSGSSSSQKHPQTLQTPGGGASGAGGSTHGFPSANQRQHLLPHQAQQQEGNKPLVDCPSTTDGRNSQAQKNIYAHNFTMPMHPQNFALMATATTPSALGGSGGHGDKQPVLPQQNQSLKMELASSQAFAMPFAPFNGVAAVPPGFDFSSMAQNHAIFQSLPEAARHGYNQITTAAAAAATATAQAAQQKKSHLEDGKSAGGESIGANAVGEEERRMITGSKGPSSGLQHSFSFSRPDGGPSISSMLGNSVIDSSSQTLGLIPAPTNRSSCAAATTTSATAVSIVNIPNSQQQQQQQQQLLQLQKQQQQLQMQLQLASSRTKSSGSSSNVSVCSERLPAAGSAVTKFPHALVGFPQALFQGGTSSQSPQWKASTPRAATPTLVQSSAPLVVKNNPPTQQQGRAPQQSCPAQSHQTQISFGANPTKAVPAGGTSNPSSSSASAVAIGSPPNSVSKSANGSPRASVASVKPCSSAVVLPPPQQSSIKSSASSSGQKSSPVNNNRNAPSILGHPHIAPAPNSSTKPQQQHAQQVQKPQQPFPQAQLFFSNPYMHAQYPQSNVGAAAASGYYQRRSSEQPSQPPQQQQQQQQSNATPSSSGMLALGPSALTFAGASATTDPAKALPAAASANGMKGMPPPGLFHAAHLAVAAQSASGAPHTLIPVSFPYMSVPAGSLKPASDQKPAAGNDNLHACWQPEKR